MSLQAAFIMILPSTRTCSTIMLYISSATNDPWPHPLHFYFLLLFLFVSHYQDSFPKTHNHVCSCSYHPEILTCVSSVLLLNVHTWINVCSSCSFCDSWGSYIVCFLNENMVKPVQNDYFSLWLSTEAVAFSPRPHPYLPCFAPLSRERLSLHCSPN